MSVLMCVREEEDRGKGPWTPAFAHGGSHPFGFRQFRKIHPVCRNNVLALLDDPHCSATKERIFQPNCSSYVILTATRLNLQLLARKSRLALLAGSPGATRSHRPLSFQAEGHASPEVASHLTREVLWTWRRDFSRLGRLFPPWGARGGGADEWRGRGGIAASGRRRGSAPLLQVSSWKGPVFRAQGAAGVLGGRSPGRRQPLEGGGGGGAGKSAEGESPRP